MHSPAELKQITDATLSDFLPQCVAADPIESLEFGDIVDQAVDEIVLLPGVAAIRGCTCSPIRAPMVFCFGIKALTIDTTSRLRNFVGASRDNIATGIDKCRSYLAR